MIQTGIHDVNDTTRPYVLPPGTPKDRVRILRKAFMETLKDPQFLDDAAKSRLLVDPLSGEELERTVAGFFKLNPETLAKLKRVLK